MTESNSKKSEPKEAMIKDHLQRAFKDKAAEELPTDLMALIEKLKEQDGQNGTS